MDMSLSKLWEIVKEGEAGMLQSMGSQRVGHNWVAEQQLRQERPGKEQFEERHGNQEFSWDYLLDLQVEMSSSKLDIHAEVQRGWGWKHYSGMSVH